MVGKTCGQFFHGGQNVGERFLFAFGESVSRIAIRAAEIARGEADKNARQPGKSAFTLQAQIDFVDDERVGHGCSLAGGAKIEMSLRNAAGFSECTGLFCGEVVQKLL